MKNIRIGKDIALQWTVTVDGVSRDLSELDLRLFLHNETAGSAVELAFTTNVDVLRAEVLGRDQRNTGVYRLTLWLNKGSEGQSVLDESTAFRLVARTEMEGGEDDNNLETETVELSGNLTTDGYRDYSELSERVEVLEQQMPVSLEADSSPDTSWLENKNGDAVIEIGGATMQRNGFMTTNHVGELGNATQKNTEQDARLSVIERDMPNKATKEEVYGYALHRTQYHEDKVFVEQVNGGQAQINAATSENAGVMSAAQVQALGNARLNGYQSGNNFLSVTMANGSTAEIPDSMLHDHAGVGQVESDLQSEVTRATGAESSLQLAISAETSRATNAEAALQTAVDSKASAYDLFQLNVRTQKKVTLVEEASAVATLAPAVDTYTRLNAAVGTLEVTLPAINASTNTYAVSLMLYMETGASPAVTFVSADNRPIVYYDGFALDANAKYEVSALFNGSKWVLANGTIA